MNLPLLAVTIALVAGTALSTGIVFYVGRRQGRQDRQDDSDLLEDA